jgi:tetratricopeptide (TPR) repeat protein
MILFLSLVSYETSAQATYEVWTTDTENDQVEKKIIFKGIDLVYNLEFKDAKTVFQGVIQRNPEHPTGYFYDGMIIWWKIMIDMENKSYDKLFESKMQKVIDICDNILLKDRNNYDALFFKGASLGFRGRLLANRKSWIKAAADAKSSLPIVDRLKRIKENNEDVKFGLGLYNYYVGALPEKYPFLKPMTVFLPKGDKLKGINQLKEASRKAEFASTEAIYFLSKIYYTFEKDYRQAHLYAKQLHQLYPKNTFFYEYMARTAYSSGQLNESYNLYKSLLEEINTKNLKSNDHIRRKIYFYLGKIEFYKNNCKQALSYLEQSLEITTKMKRETSYYDAYGYLEVGKMYDCLGKRKIALSYYQKVLNIENILNIQNLLVIT